MSLSQGRSWGAGRGISVPHPSIKHFTTWLGAKPGLSSRWVRRTLASAEQLAQFSTAPGMVQPPTKALPRHLACWELLWMSAVAEMCSSPSQRWQLATAHRNMFSEGTMFSRGKFVCWFFFFNEIMYKTHKRYVHYWWNFNEDWNPTRINVIVFFLEVWYTFPGSSNRLTHSHSVMWCKLS